MSRASIALVARDNNDIVTRVIQPISPSQSGDNLFITYFCLYQASNREINRGYYMAVRRYELYFRALLISEHDNTCNSYLHTAI